MNAAVSNPRILVADDQSDVLEALQFLLKNEGFSIDVANSPAAVLEAIDSRSYDILLLDMNYARDTTSGGEGLELLSMIQQKDEALPVVMMTAWANVDLAVEAMRTGGSDFVQKPWDNEKLLYTLRSHLANGSRKREKQELERASQRIRQDMAEAHQIQQRLLSLEIPKIPGWDIQTAWQPAGEIGGDYFDAIQLDHNFLALCIADVAGKGLSAALLMSNVQASVRAFAQATRSPAEMCRKLNRAISDSTIEGRFVTLFYSVLDRTTGSLRYANAGHVPPVIVRRDGGSEELQEGGTVLGMFPDAAYEESQVTFRRGDSMVLLTDGITEAENAEGREFGQKGVVSLLVRNRKVGASELKQRLLKELASFSSGRLQDDAALMIVSML